MSAASERAGVVLDVAGGAFFVSADVAVEVAERPAVTRVPGSGLGVALISGRVVAVVTAGEHSEHTLLCDVGGDGVALDGVRVHQVGTFPATAEGVSWAGQHLRELDVGAAIREHTRGAR